MKIQKYFTSILLTVLLIAPLNLSAQENEMPITTSSKEALQLFLTGRDKSEKFELTAANQLFNETVQKDPDFAVAHAYLAWQTQFSGQTESARKSIEKDLKASNKVSEGEKRFIYYCQAFVEGNSSKQKEHLVQLITLFPSDKRALAWMGSYYYGETDYETAIKYFKKSLELDDKYVLAYNLLGYAHSFIGNNGEAEKAFKTYIKLDPNSTNSYDSYGDFLFKTRKYDEAIENFKKAFKKNANFRFSLRKAGCSYFIKGDYNNTRVMYKRFYDAATDSKVKMKALYWHAEHISVKTTLLGL